MGGTFDIEDLLDRVRQLRGRFDDEPFSLAPAIQKKWKKQAGKLASDLRAGTKTRDEVDTFERQITDFRSAFNAADAALAKAERDAKWGDLWGKQQDAEKKLQEAEKGRSEGGKARANKNRNELKERAKEIHEEEPNLNCKQICDLIIDEKRKKRIGLGVTERTVYDWVLDAVPEASKGQGRPRKHSNQ
jgi:hypothetical protein